MVDIADKTCARITVGTLTAILPTASCSVSYFPMHDIVTLHTLPPR